MKLENWLFLTGALGVLMILPLVLILVIAVLGLGVTPTQVFAAFMLALIGAVVTGVTVVIWTEAN